MSKILKVNRTDHIEVIEIKKIVMKRGIPWVYKKSGYPHAYKANEGLSLLKLRLVNLGYTIHDFNFEGEE